MATQAFSSMKESSRRLLGGEPEEKSALQEMEEAVCSVCPSLSWRNRLIGYGACLAAGFILTFGSMFRLVGVLCLAWDCGAAKFRLSFRLASHCVCCKLFFVGTLMMFPLAVDTPSMVSACGMPLNRVC